jgi:predicted Fe-Mo cluster-binding NifX family protein
MKIAAVSEDGTTVSQHFGRATYYVVFTVEEGRVVKREKREKSTHHVAGQEHQAVAGERHGFDAAAQSTHAGMMSNIADCQVVMAGGMGLGARESLKAAGIETVMTDVLNMDEAINLYIAGRLPNRTERLH